MCLEFDKPTEEAINATLMAVVLPCLVVAAVSLLMYIAFGEKPAHYSRCRLDAPTTTTNTTK